MGLLYTKQKQISASTATSLLSLEARHSFYLAAKRFYMLYHHQQQRKKFTANHRYFDITLHTKGQTQLYLVVKLSWNCSTVLFWLYSTKNWPLRLLHYRQRITANIVHVFIGTTMAIPAISGRGFFFGLFSQHLSAAFTVGLLLPWCINDILYGFSQFVCASRLDITTLRMFTAKAAFPSCVSTCLSVCSSHI